MECSLGMKEKQTVYQSAIEALARLHASKEMVQYLESYPWTIFNDIMQPFRDPRPQFSESFNFNGFWEWRVKALNYHHSCNHLLLLSHISS